MKKKTENNLQPIFLKDRISKYILNTLLPIIFNGAIIGTLVGIIIWLYNFFAEHILEFSVSMYKQVQANLAFLPVLFIVLAGLAILMSLLLRFIPQLTGSGIPYTEGVMRGQLKYKKTKMFFGTIVYSFITFLTGAPMGSEGPSVQLGGIIGNTVNEAESKIKWKSKAVNRLSITAGASSGLAVAFNAPLTGLVFALEEGHKKFCPMILLTTSVSIIFAVITSRLINIITGIRTTFDFVMFDFGSIQILHYTQIWLLFIVGIAVGIGAALFSLIMHHVKSFYETFKVKRVVRLLIAFLLVGIVGVFFTDVLGGGASLIKQLVIVDETGKFKLGIGIVAILLCLKIILISLCSNSGTTGGLFIPMLAIGALIGSLLGQLFIAANWLDPKYFTMIMVLAMSAFMAAVTRAPITGIILVAEITGELLGGFLETAVVVVIAYFIVQLLNITPLYDELLDDTYEKLHENDKIHHMKIEERIDDGSFCVGRTVRDIMWPYGCHIDKIIIMKQDGTIKEVSDKEGERVIHSGDIFYFTIETYDTAESIEELRALTSNKLADDDKIVYID